MEKEKIMKADKTELVDCVIDSFSEDDVKKIEAQAYIMIRANELGISDIISKAISDFKKQDKQFEIEYKRELAYKKSEIKLLRNNNGIPVPSIENFLTIMQNDSHYQNIRFNLLANRAEVYDGNNVRVFSDSDYAASKCYIESKYKIHNDSKHQDALRLLFKSREFHPIKNIIDGLVWDGKERIKDALHIWLKADDSLYVQEVSRLIFAGGIHRLYNPGCKFDDVPVLIGTKQGEGKSSFVRWLAINDSYYSEVTEFDGQRGIEQLEGSWICEIAELLALTRVKEQEAVKAYITRQFDKYRKPYDRQTEELPRRCIFIGTTNNEQFLKDKTGNRRFYPVKVYSDGRELFEKGSECREYIIQCWAEAKAKLDSKEMMPFADKGLLDYYKEAQDNAMEDDWRVGAIQEYLDLKEPGEKVCVKQIMWEVISPNKDFPQNPTKSESAEIVQIMTKMEGWKKSVTSTRFLKYGTQRYWEKELEKAETDKNFEDLPFV